MKFFILLSLLLSGFSAHAWTHKTVISEVSGYYHSATSDEQFAIRLHAGNQLEFSYKIGNLNSVMYMACEKAEEGVYSCVAQNRVRQFQITIGKSMANTLAVVSVDGQEMTSLFVKQFGYKLRF